MDKNIHVGEMVTVGDQLGEFIVHEIHDERKTADLMVITTHPVKLKGVPITELNKNAKNDLMAHPFRMDTAAKQTL